MYVKPEALNNSYLVALPEHIWARTCYGTINDGSSWDQERTEELEHSRLEVIGSDPEELEPQQVQMPEAMESYLYVSLELGKLHLAIQTPSGRAWYRTRWGHHITIGYLLPVQEDTKQKLQRNLDRAIQAWRAYRIAWQHNRPHEAVHYRMMMRFNDALSDAAMAGRNRPPPDNPHELAPITHLGKEHLSLLYDRNMIDFRTYPTRIVMDENGEFKQDENGKWLTEDIPLTEQLLHDHYDRAAIRYGHFVDIERQARQLHGDVTVETAQYHPIDVSLQKHDFPKLQTEAEVMTLCYYLSQACVSTGCWHWASKAEVMRNTALLQAHRWHITPQTEREGPAKDSLDIEPVQDDRIIQALFDDYECSPGHGHQEPWFRRPLVPDGCKPDKIMRRPWRHVSPTDRDN